MAEIYEFRGFHIPEYMMEGIENYINKHIPAGDFLRAVICNDLRQAVHCADDTNIHNLPAYVSYFYNEAPSQCWGSREKYISWCGDRE